MPLAIVQRGRFATFTLLARTFEGRPDARVVWDRRVYDRRRTASPVAEDGRLRDRRRDPTTTWEHQHLHYLLVSAADDSHDTNQPGESLALAAHLAVIALASDRVQGDVEAAVRSDVNVLLSGGDRLTRRSLAPILFT